MCVYFFFVMFNPQNTDHRELEKTFLRNEQFNNT